MTMTKKEDEAFIRGFCQAISLFHFGGGMKVTTACRAAGITLTVARRAGVPEQDIEVMKAQGMEEPRPIAFELTRIPAAAPPCKTDADPSGGRS